MPPTDLRKRPGHTSVEIHFFGTDLNFWWFPKLTEAGYLDIYSDATNERRVGERSNSYLLSERAATEIKAFSPSALIIMMLRNPVDMLYALHHQMLENGYEEILDFCEALTTEEYRMQGQSATDDADFVNSLFYRNVVRYAEQVQRYTDVFGRANVHIIVYDDFKRDAPGVYRETLSFLGVDANFRPKFTIMNPSKRVRTQLLRDPPAITRRLAKGLMPKYLRRKVWGILGRINATRQPLRPMDPELRRQLQAEFAPDVAKLGKIIERDLRHWLG